ncbi:hypothetical protein ILYODFUR_009553 [Ilyodon furcidens]|uniref:Uncharacterized protein n=1 Tax=Ilyodon furcidens TaxID=33524 RepID=A0ABV0TUK0_9TELE
MIRKTYWSEAGKHAIYYFWKDEEFRQETCIHLIQSGYTNSNHISQSDAGGGICPAPTLFLCSALRSPLTFGS